MRSFTNRNGEKVIVSEEHLKTAVEIKKQLQNASPSRSASWKTLVELMHVEGFEDAEASENYRTMIKKYQKSIGELPSKTEVKDAQVTSKLESIKELVGDINYAKEENKQVLRKLNKVKREVLTKTLLIEEVKETIKQHAVFNVDNVLKLSFDHNESEALVLCSDWHVGLDIEGFNYEIAKKQVEMFANKVVKHCMRLGIGKVYVAGIGDLLEGSYMRTNQAYTIEFTLSEQIVKTAQLMIMFLTNLAQVMEVEYVGSVLGNHSRMFVKGQTLDNDSAENVVHEYVKMFIEMSNLKTLTSRDCLIDSSELGLEIQGKKIKIVHGDKVGHKDNNRLNKHISSDNVFWDILCYGHLHMYQVDEHNHGRMTVRSGCLPVATKYSKDLGFNGEPSQAMIAFVDGEALPIRIGLGLT